MKYFYVGVTRHREQVSGAIEASDEVEAQMKLRSMQIRPLELAENKSAAMLSFNLGKLNEITIGNPIDLKQMMIFTRQFSSLIDAGIPVVQCLDILWDQEKKPIFKKVLGRVKTDIEAGAGLAESLGKHPKIFNDFFVRIVEAGEISGTLDIALRRIGAQLEKLGRLKSKVIGALTYPIVTIVVAACVLVFLLVKVVPEVTKLYSENNAELPMITQKVLVLSAWFQEYYSLLFFGFIGAAVGSVFLYRVPAFRAIWDPLIIRSPIFGTLVLKAEIAKFTRTLGTLLGTGVPLLSAFEIVAKLVNNLSIKESIERAATFVSEGKSIAAGLSEKKLFPPMVVHMVSIGEMTGKLDDLLGKIGDIYDEEVDDAVGNITGLLQPALIVVVGIMIAFMMAAMYLPIFQLAEKMTGGV